MEINTNQLISLSYILSTYLNQNRVSHAKSNVRIYLIEFSWNSRQIVACGMWELDKVVSIKR